MLEKKFEIEIKTLLPKSPSKIAVAVSGGADSLSLALLLKYAGIKFVALIVDHGLRIESAKEASSVQKHLRRLKIESHILKWSDNKPKSNIHENARRARYKLLTNYCHENNIRYLLVAHTKNDQAETIMLRIFRGSGVDGISGIKKKTTMNGITVIRPLLDIKRGDIELFLKSKKIKWIDDPSNYNTKFERVRVRQLLSSFHDKDLWLDRLSLLGENASRSSDYIKKRVRSVFKKLIEIDKFGFISVPHSKFLKLHEEIALKLLVKIITRFSDKEHQPRLASLEKCYEQIISKKDTVLGGIEIKHHKDKVLFIRELKKVDKEIKNGIWDNRFFITPNNKFKIAPLGEDGWKQVKSKVKKKNWPHIKIVYSLPTLFEKKKVVACPLLEIGTSKFKADLAL